MGAIGAKSDTRIQAVTALREAVYGIQEVNRFEGHNGAVLDVDVSPDGELIASAGQDGTVKIWNRAGQLLASIPEESPHDTEGGSIWESINAIEFSPDGTKIAFPNRQDIQFLDNDGNTLKTLRYSGEEPSLAGLGIHTIKFSLDGKNIAYGGNDYEVRLETTDGNSIAVLSHETAVKDISFSSDNSVIATTSLGGIVKIWDRKGNLLNQLQHFRSDEIDYDRKIFLESASFSPVDDIIASAGGDGSVKLWKIDGTPIQEFNAHDEGIKSINFNSEGNIIITASRDNTVKLWTTTGKILKTITGHTGAVNEAKFTSDGNDIVTASDDGTVRLWGLDTLAIKTLSAHSDSVTDVEFSPDGKSIATASKDKTLELWNTENYSSKTLTGHNQSVNSVSFSPDSRLIASSEEFGESFKLWNIDGNLVKTVTNYFESEYENIEEVKFSPKNKLIISAGHLVFGVRSYDGSPKYKINPDEVDVGYWNIAISPNNQFVSAYKAQNTRVYAEEPTLKVWRFSGEKFASLSGNKATFGYDNKTILTAGSDGILRLYNINGDLVRTLTGHGKAVTDIHFSPNNQMIASSSEDRTVRLWSREGTLIETLEHEESVTALSFSPDSKTLAAALDNGKVVLWNLDINDLLAKGCDKIRGYLENNSNVAPEDKKLCNGVPAAKNE